MFLRTLIGALAALAVLLPTVRAIVNTDGTFKEEILCELKDGVLGKQCGAESCSAQGNCSPKCCALPEPQPPVDPAVGQRSTKACRENAPTNNADCRFVSNKQSIEAKIGEFPYLVALGYKFNNNDTEYKWLCGGGLISEYFVLTTQNCVAGGRKGPELALLGSVHPPRDAVSAAAPHTQKIPIAATFVHPEWSSIAPQRNNIALVRLAKAARFSDSVRPACLFAGRNPPLPRATVAGFGLNAWTVEENKISNKVIKVDVPFTPKDKCNEFLSRVVKSEVNDTTVICAGEKGKDTCRGDSGAPLVIKSGQPFCSYQILGLTAFGSTTCGSSTPSGYTRVHPYLSWIELTVWP